MGWKLLALSSVFVSVAACKTVVVEYDDTVIQDNIKYGARQEAVHYSEFMKNAKSNEGYYRISARFLDVEHSELPGFVKQKARHPISIRDVCASQVEDLKQDKITGLMGIYTGDPIKFEDLGNVRDQINPGHYFVMLDPIHGKDEIKCHIDEQEYTVLSTRRWNTYDPVKVNFVMINSLKIDTKVEDVVDTLTGVFKFADPTGVVFKLSELTEAESAGTRIGDLLNAGLSEKSVLIKPQTFLIGQSAWDQKTRRYVEVSYFVKDTSSETPTIPKRTIGFVEVLFEARPSVLITGELKEGYPDFAGYTVANLPASSVDMLGTQINLNALLNQSLPSASEMPISSGDFNFRCQTLDGQLKTYFKLAEIDRAAVLSLFAERAMPNVFSSSTKVPSIVGLPPIPIFTYDESESEQLRERDAGLVKLRAVEQSLEQYLAAFQNSCLQGRTALMAKIGSRVGRLNEQATMRLETVRKRIEGFENAAFNILPPERVSETIRNRVHNAFYRVEGRNRVDADFSAWMEDGVFLRVRSPLAKIIANDEYDESSLGQGVNISRTDFIALTKTVWAQFGCYLNIANNESEEDRIPIAFSQFDLPGYDLMGLLEYFGDDIPDNNRISAVFLKYGSHTGDGRLPKVAEFRIVKIEKKQLDVLKARLPSNSDCLSQGGLWERTKTALESQVALLATRQ
ncbi:hypothetical protein HH303_07075 [Rhodospirillaceae bacterium KN72]|uniref:Uncharacterized protein n=1 Tax=Pacificispira spongiicola TaxID=2729598 RepID=A0A7Y0DZ37_9PROT|nr:hypothetical protein [Pacificispira spongiicola]NMM44233.1 hypothetical protein [Pacificispira spongiicola]